LIDSCELSAFLVANQPSNNAQFIGFFLLFLRKRSKILQKLRSTLKSKTVYFGYISVSGSAIEGSNN